MSASLLTGRHVVAFKDWIPLVVIFFWGFGQIFPYQEWYLHGISLPDILILFYLLFFLARDVDFRGRFVAAFSEHRFIVTLTFLLVAVLSVSTLTGKGGGGTHTPYLLLSIFRNIYFLFIALTISILAAQQDKRRLMILLYMTGLVLVASWYVVNSFSQESLQLWGTICGRPVIDQRNVVGNMMAVGLVFSILLLLESGAVSILFALAFPYLLLYTFSKGAWLMGLIAGVGYFGVALLSRRLVAVLFLIPIIIFGYIYQDHFSCLVTAKFESASESTAIRLNYAINSVEAAYEKPLGKGLGWALPTDKSELQQSAATTGYSSYGNPHSAFLHILQTGGWIGLVLYVLLFLYPFYLMFHHGSPSLKIAAILMGLAFGVSGAVQLQLYSQHFFWIFCGFIFAIVKHPRPQG